MKTYCKPATVNIEDWKFNEIAVVECFRNKRRRKDFQRLLCKTGKITKEGGNAFGSVDLWAFPKLQTGRNDLAFSTNGARVIVRYSPMWL